MDENTPDAAQPVSPAAGDEQAAAPSRFDDLDYRALQGEAKNFDGVAGNLPEAELRAALIEADARPPIPENETDEQRAAREARPDQDARRDRARAAAGEPTAAERDAAREKASTGNQTTISPEDAIQRATDKLNAKRAARGETVR